MNQPVSYQYEYLLNPAVTKASYNGRADWAVNFLLDEQMKDRALWAKFVQQFRDQIDGDDRGWRGEFWGKTMRGAALIYEYTKDEEFYQILTETVKDLLTVAEEDGRVSTFKRDIEFTAWDVWCRKYVLLGLEYYYDICRDEALKAEILSFMRGCADYVVSHIGKESEGKRPLTICCYSWLGLNASSVLEPMVWLYRLTGEESYLKFATYVVENGGSHMHNVFELAYENKIAPYQYGVEKAYEMISCFEGLLEYARVTGIEKYKTAAINFAHALIDTEVTVIGSCGCTHEMFDHGKTRQTDYYLGIMQENCVAVTWLKFCSRMLCLTGERLFADNIEHTFFNAYLGAANTQRYWCDDVANDYGGLNNPESKILAMSVPFDSYSPLRPGRRGRKNSGLRIFKDKSYYTCCSSIAGAGVGSYLRTAVLEDAKGLTVCFYENGTNEITYNGKTVTLVTETAYPVDGKVKLTVKTAEPMAFALRLRLPAWSKKTAIASDLAWSEIDGFAVFENEWKGENVITLDLDMRIRETLPITWTTDVLYIETHYNSEPPVVVLHEDADDDFVSLSRGPLTLAVDSRMGKDANSVFSFRKDEDGFIICDDVKGYCDFISENPCTVLCSFTSPKGEKFKLIDYASAGKDGKTYIAAWLPSKIR